MTESEMDAYVDSMLPEWAIAKCPPGTWPVGAQLPTKDGRRIGNAHIIDIMPAKWQLGVDAYQIITDAGNRMVYTLEELMDAFHPPQWVSDPVRTLAHFERIDHLDY